MYGRRLRSWSIASGRASGRGTRCSPFPRDGAGRSATFAEAEERLPEIARLGFDVVYLTPIHPIGTSHRKGRNNALEAGPSDPGSPYAIGSKEGGHKAVHPDLGTLEDFEHFVDVCCGHGMEVALDLAIQCSPDHPYIREHPEWFDFRPDGSIKYAENPPKKYQDIVNVDFYSEDGEICGGSGSMSFCSGLLVGSKSSGSIIRTPSHSRSGNGL